MCNAWPESKPGLKWCLAIIALRFNTQTAVRLLPPTHVRQIARLEHRPCLLDDDAHFTFGMTVLLRNMGRRPLMVNALSLDEILHYLCHVLAAVRACCRHSLSCVTSGQFDAQPTIRNSSPSSALPTCMTRTASSDTWSFFKRMK